MKIVLALVFVLAATAAVAAPFLVCDQQAGVEFYTITGPGWVPATVPAQADGSIRMDVSAAGEGANTLSVKACRQDPTWGALCSDASPFEFTRPSRPITPTYRLAP
jgi:hypothetical protein